MYCYFVKYILIYVGEKVELFYYIVSGLVFVFVKDDEYKEMFLINFG